MPRMSAAERRRELVEAAVRVMVREGVAAVTTRAVVAEAGMTLGAFHYCFASKQELLREVTGVMIEREVRAGVAPLLVGRGPREMVTEALRAFLRVVEERPEEQQVLLELTQYALRTSGQADLARLQYETYHRAAQTVLAAFTEAAHVEWTVPLPLAARTLISMLDGLTLSYLADRDSERAAELLTALADCLLALTRPAAEHAPEADVAAGPG